MSYGYSQLLIEANRSASAHQLGVALGRACIKAKTSVNDIATQLGVSRTTIYNWFVGTSTPHPRHHAAINKLLKRSK
jgi:hypothetical protein